MTSDTTGFQLEDELTLNSGRQLKGELALYSVDPDGRWVRKLAQGSTYKRPSRYSSEMVGRLTGHLLHFDVSPDGRRIAYSTCIRRPI